MWTVLVSFTAAVKGTPNSIDEIGVFAVQATDDAAATTRDTPIDIDVLANDFSDTGIINLSAVSIPPNGATEITTEQTIFYRPDTEFTGIDSFIYLIDDGLGDIGTGAVTITVEEPINNPPQAQNDQFEVPEDSVSSLLPVFTDNGNGPDTDPENDPLIISTIGTASQGGAVSINLAANGILYTPVTNFFGLENFTYTITDGNGGSDTAQVTITIQSVNDPPIANDDTFTVQEDSLNNILPILQDNGSGQDNDIENDSLSLSTVGPTDNGGTTAIDETGVGIIYTPAVDFAGMETFTYTITDGNGGSGTALVTVNVEMLATDPLITAIDDEATTSRNVSVEIDVLFNDSSDSGVINLQAVSIPINGISEITQLETIIYTPNTDFTGIDSFVYIIDDGIGDLGTGNVTITVEIPLGIPPVAHEDTATTIMERAIDLQVLSNDEVSIDNPVGITQASDPPHGVVTINPDDTITYEPGNSFLGIDQFIYTISDDSGQASTATITINVEASESYASWRTEYFGNTNDPDGDPLADPNLIGLANLIIYALGINPQNRDTERNKLPRFQIDGTGEHCLLFSQRKNIADIVLDIELSPAITVWTTLVEGVDFTRTATDEADGTESVKIVFDQDIANNTKIFVRLKILLL